MKGREFIKLFKNHLDAEVFVTCECGCGDAVKFIPDKLVEQNFTIEQEADEINCATYVVTKDNPKDAIRGVWI